MVKDGIILTGGTGSRLQPFTSYVSKHLLNVAGKPIIDYPINTLKQMGVENLTIVVGSSFSGQILDYVQDGARYGMNINYCYQPKPQGIAEAINCCKRYVSDKSDGFAVILGDNFFELPVEWQVSPTKASIALNKHSELHRFGVASIQNNKIVQIEEKPKTPRADCDNYAITGCYLFTPEFFDMFQCLKPSPRDEYEIVDIIRLYHLMDRLNWTMIRGEWSDMGTVPSVAHVSDFLYRKEH